MNRNCSNKLIFLVLDIVLMLIYMNTINMKIHNTRPYTLADKLTNTCTYIHTYRHKYIHAYIYT